MNQSKFSYDERKMQLVVDSLLTVFIVPSGQMYTCNPGSCFTVRVLGQSCLLEHDKQIYYLHARDDRYQICATIPSAEKLVELSQAWERLRQFVYDPEFAVNIVDLGLVYDISWSAQTISVTMTLTSPACGMGYLMVAAVKDALKFTNILAVTVSLVFDPPWNSSMLSEAALLDLGL